MITESYYWKKPLLTGAKFIKKYMDEENISDAQFALTQSLLSGAVFSEEEIDQALARLLQEHGKLNSRLVEAAPDLPSVPILIRRFGSMEELYGRVGYRHRYLPARP